MGSLILLAAVLWLANRIGSIKIDWIKSVKVCYAIGYASGLVFGLLENWLSYGTLSGIRAATPFLHALETGMVGVGICYVLTRGRRGLVRLFFLYSGAVLLHFDWNSGSLAVWRVLGASGTVIGLAVFLFSLLAWRGRRPGAKCKYPQRG